MSRKIIVDELHRQARHNFKRLPVVTKGIDDLWQSDLIEMASGQLKNLDKINKGYKYLLTVIDTFSKFAWAVPLKSKTGKCVTEAFRTIINQSGRSPRYLQTDNGKEFYNSVFQQFIKSQAIQHYSSYSDLKASIVERFNRTLKNLMYKQFTLQGNYKWINILPELLHKYNNSVHSTINMKPSEVTSSDEQKLISTVYYPRYQPTTRKAKYKVGDQVRISKYKHLFKRGFTRNWSTELFTVVQVKPGTLNTYIIKDHRGEILKGRFYEQELSKTKQPDTYLIEKIIRRKGNKLLVKWLGLPEHSWIDADKVII